MAGYKSPGRKISEYIGIIAIVAVFAGVFYKKIKNLLILNYIVL